MKQVLKSAFFSLTITMVSLVLFGCEAAKRDTSALVNYIEVGDLVSAQKCLDAGADINGFRKEGWSGHEHDGETPLAVAIKSGSLETVKWVIVNGADVNKKSNGYGYPITISAMKGNMAIVQELEKSGVDFDVRYLGIKSSDWASRNGSDEGFVSYLRSKETSDKNP